MVKNVKKKETSQEKINIHPNVDCVFTDTYHVKYKNLHSLITQNKHVNNGLTRIQRMANPNTNFTPYVSHFHQNAQTSSEIIEEEFVKSFDIPQHDNNKNLIEVLTNCLRQAKYDENKITQTLKSFDPRLTVESYLRSNQNVSVVRAQGLPNTKCLRALLDEINDPSNKQRRRVEVEITPQHILANITQIDVLQTDVVRNNFIKNVEAFKAKAANPKGLNGKALHKAGVLGMQTLTTIQLNCLFIAQSFLVSTKNPNTLSLSEYSARKSFQKHTFNTKDLNRVFKTAQTSKDPLDLISNDQDLPYNFSCFKCPSSSAKNSNANDRKTAEEEGHANEGGGLKFVDTIKANFNVFKALPISSWEDYRQHVEHVHQISHPSLTKKLGGHTELFLCTICDPSTIEFAFACCTDHMFDHNNLLHRDELFHLRVLGALKEAFVSNTAIIKIIEKYLMSVCVFCHAFFENKQQVNRTRWFVLFVLLFFEMI